jgi:NAD-dependent dihydropyrimidine dehydrogenase PreA subunit
MASDPSSRGPGEYTGIPRERIAWFPTIDPHLCRPEKCELNCVAWCQEHVYGRQADGRVVVARPYSCNVGDISCSFQCPFDAISFPSKQELRAMLQEARK